MDLRCPKCGKKLSPHRNEVLLCQKCMKEQQESTDGVFILIGFIVFFIVLSIIF